MSLSQLRSKHVAAPEKEADEIPSNKVSKWANGCEYKCLECGRVYWNYNTLLQHINLKHDLDIREYKKAHRVHTLMTKSVNFVCNLCRSLVCHNPLSLGQHARTKHGMLLCEFHLAHVKAAEKVAEENRARAGLSEEEVLRKWTQG